MTQDNNHAENKVTGYLTEGLSANEQDLAISVKKGYDVSPKSSEFDQDADFLG
jgi:hypothetical protein